MGMRTVFFMAIALAACQCRAAVGTVEKCPKAYAGLKVEVQMRDSVLPRGQPIPVIVTLHNGGTLSFHLRPYMEPTWYWLSFEIYGPAGQKIPWRGTEVNIIDDGTRMTLDPGYFWGRRIDDLRDSYALATPGRYRIRAIYGISPLGECSHGSIVSDPVSFEVR